VFAVKADVFERGDIRQETSPVGKPSHDLPVDSFARGHLRNWNCVALASFDVLDMKTSYVTERQKFAIG
jgi:hypothetical protein